MNLLDIKYINILSPFLKNFKRKSNNLYNFSCPICGDSSKNKNKARGYFYESEHGNAIFKCHNCGFNSSFPNLLKDKFPNIFSDYNFEKFENKQNNVNNEIINPPTPNISIKIEQYADKITNNEEALNYIKKRQIPEYQWDRIYFSKSLSNFEPLFKDKNYDFSKIKDEIRIIFPIYNFNNQLVGINARSISNNKFRYVNLKIKSEDSFIFGIDKINLSKPKFILEGAFDSLFFNNSLAVNGSDLLKVDHLLNKDDILIFDNQPYNIDLIKIMKKLIDKNLNIFIWPENIKEKDINELIINGFDINNLEKFIRENTYKDLQLNLQFNIWKKIKGNIYGKYK